MGEIRLHCEISNLPGGRGHSLGGRNGRAFKRRTLDALVDTGAVEVLLPVELVRALGIKTFGKTPVTLADNRSVTLPVAGPLWIRAFNRLMVTDCLVGPRGCEPLVGQIVLERLDLVLDPKKRSVLPRTPSGPVLKLKHYRRCQDTVRVAPCSRQRPLRPRFHNMVG